MLCSFLIPCVCFPGFVSLALGIAVCIRWDFFLVRFWSMTGGHRYVKSHLYLKANGKTLCEILTVADAMSLPMADPRVDQNLSRYGSMWPSIQWAVAASGADCHGMVAMPSDDGKTDSTTQAEKRVSRKTTNGSISLWCHRINCWEVAKHA